jgi:hypothetical protein
MQNPEALEEGSPAENPSKKQLEIEFWNSLITVKQRADDLRAALMRYAHGVAVESQASPASLPRQH